MTAEKAGLPVVLWTIPCFDRRRLQPLPLYNRTFSLDWSKLSTSETEEILRILNNGERDHGHSPKGFDSVVVTVSREVRKPDWRMLDFRRFFVEVPEEAMSEVFKEAERGSRPFKFVSLNAEYSEDETGAAVTDYDMIRHVSGQETPIIIGDAQSVLRLGPKAPEALEDWDAVTANTIGQFLEVVRQICSSAWYKSSHRITFETVRLDASRYPEPKAGALLEAVFPDAEETMAVLTYFRQLHGKDRLLEKAVRCYIAHCPDARKQWWVNERLAAFQAIVDSAPRPLELVHTRRAIVQMFMYGAGMFHTSSNGDDAEKLTRFIDLHGTHNAVMIFNHCLWDFLSLSKSVFYVIRQDFEHWINVHDLLKPNRQVIAELFQSHPSARTS